MELSGSGEISDQTAQPGSPVAGRVLGSRGEDVRGEQSEEHFYDCQESLELPHGGGVEEEKESLHPQTHTNIQAESLHGGGGRRSPQPAADAGGEDEESWSEVKAEEADGGMDSDVELKEEKNTAPEFDDDYLREVEKDLSEEEKESRRLESLSLKEKGNDHFKAGEHFEAEQSYTQALCVCPVCYSRERAVLFSNRAAARIHLDRKELAIADCSRAIELNPDYMRAILRRAELYEKTDKLDEALEDYKTILDKDPGNNTAREACMRLPQQIHERNEKLKEEMMSKLKDLGNLFLRPFGLSTNNFQVNQDAATGSYSVNFVQSPNNNNR